MSSGSRNRRIERWGLYHYLRWPVLRPQRRRRDTYGTRVYSVHGCTNASQLRRPMGIRHSGSLRESPLLLQRLCSSSEQQNYRQYRWRTRRRIRGALSSARKPIANCVTSQHAAGAAEAFSDALSWYLQGVKPFHIFNSLSRSVEEFQPQNPPEVSMYSCGPTVYLPPHLGNMRAYLFVDTLRRALKFNGYRVRHVMNVTDVGHMTDDADAGEDKIEKTARAEKKSPREIADHYLALFLRDMDLLRIERPDVLSRATDHVAEMIELTQRIIDRGYAYVTP